MIESVEANPTSATSPLRAATNAGDADDIGENAVMATALRISYGNGANAKNVMAITAARANRMPIELSASHSFERSMRKSSIRPIISIAIGALAGLIIPANSKTRSGRCIENADRSSMVKCAVKAGFVNTLRTERVMLRPGFSPIAIAVNTFISEGFLVPVDDDED